jgi:hypothetical protein
MAQLRYVGTSNWERTIVDNDGKFKKSERVQPGEAVDGFDDESVKKILSAPRHMRSFVEVNGSEDRYGDNYGPNRREAIAEVNNATPYPELDMGSTVTGGKAIFVSEDDNPHNFLVADHNEGPASDNTEARINAEANAAAEKARAEERAKLTRKAHPQARPSSNQKSEG